MSAIGRDPEVKRTRDEVNRLVALTPSKRYSDCTAAEKKTFDDVEEASRRHRAAVRAARAKAEGNQ